MQNEPVDLDNRFGEEYAGRYVFQEITWAKRSKIIQRHTKYHPRTGQVVSSDFIAIQAETIWAALKEQPQSNPLSLNKLLSEDDGIPIGLGEHLSKIVNKLCGITPDENRFLSEPSDAESHTQPSPTSDSAKNSAGPHSTLQNNPRKRSNSSS